MLNINTDIFNQAIEIAITKAGNDLAMIRAIDRAVKMIEENPYHDWTEKGLLIMSDTSRFTYLANGECVRFEDGKEVYCPAFYFNNHLCKHRTAYNLLRLHDELVRQSSRKTTMPTKELLDPKGQLFLASENRVPKRIKDNLVYEYDSYSFDFGGFEISGAMYGTRRVKETFIWTGSRYRRI